MPRVKRGVASHRRHLKLRESVKGQKLGRSKLVRVAREAHLHAGAYAFAGRKMKKRQRRSLWIVQLSAALSPYSLKYSRFINLLKESKIDLDRKILSQIASKDPQTFDQIVKKVTGKNP